MENIPEDQTEELRVNHPRSVQAKPSNKIINNRYINQNIYKMFLQKRYDQCLKFISKCEEDQFKIYIKALIAKNEFKLDQALDYFSQCQVLDRTNYNYLKHMAKTFILLGKFKSGLEVAKDAMKINPNDPQIYYIFGKLSLALKDPQNALVNFDLSLTKKKNQPAFIEKAKILYEDKKLVEALTVLKSAIEFSSQNAEVYELIARIKYQMGQVSDSLSYYQKALQVDETRFNTLLALGALKQGSEALQLYKKAHQISSNSAPLWNNLGIYLYDKKKIIGAYCCFKRALFLDPFRWDIHANLGLLFMKSKKFLEAEIHFKSAVKIKKDSVLFNLWGICLKNLKDIKNAEACFQQALKLEPKNEDARYNYILILKQNQRQDLAKKQFKLFLQQVIDPHLKQALYQIKEQFQ